MVTSFGSKLHGVNLSSFFRWPKWTALPAPLKLIQRMKQGISIFYEGNLFTPKQETLKILMLPTGA